MNDEIDMTSSTLNAITLWEHQEKAVNLCDAAIAFINSTILKLPPFCDHILQATDAGQGLIAGLTDEQDSQGTTRFRTKRSVAFPGCYR